jgi:hypothetical protein
MRPHVAEKKLSSVFADAARWEAVLLMDEADVFIEERMKGDLERNAFVAVLLRCLEYYDGMYAWNITSLHYNSLNGFTDLFQASSF